MESSIGLAVRSIFYLQTSLLVIQLIYKKQVGELFNHRQRAGDPRQRVSQILSTLFLSSPVSMGWLRVDE